jgi:hypothetical protein
MYNGQTTIYALVDDGVVMYVGQAKNLEKRYRQHCSLAQNRSHRKVCQWLTALLEKSQTPELLTLEITECPDERETYWIEHYRKINKDLLNIADGGKTTAHLRRSKLNTPWGNTHSPVQRRIMVIQRTIKILKKHSPKRAKRLEGRLIEINTAIKRTGLRKMNMLLWEKYGY